MKKISLLLAIVILFSSCASILNPKYQKVDIRADRKAEILVNGEEPRTEGRKIILERDHQPKQITLQKEGKIDYNTVIFPYKKSPLYIMSVIPFIVLFYPPFFDNGPKSFNYEKEIRLSNDFIDKIHKSEDEKYIKINKLGINIETGDIKFRFLDYKTFKKRSYKIDPRTNYESEDIKFEQSVFSDYMNELLKDRGYIDTTNKALKSSFLNNLFIEASIEKYTVHLIQRSIIYLDLQIDWEVLDFYDNVIYEYTTNSTSDMFCQYGDLEMEDVFNKSIKDAIDKGFIDFLQTNEVQKQLTDKSELDKEMAFDDIIIEKPEKTVSSLSEAVKSSLTIKNKDGHGSAFVISSNGYIITNYHVISDTTLEYSVVFNNGNKVKNPEVVRYSKIHDLALLKIDTTGLRAFKISKDNIDIATEIYAVGTPSSEDLNQTVSKGIVSGFRNKGETKLIQTDASINSGNSGGAICTKSGEVVGIVASKLFGFGVEGVAFGIPSKTVYDKLKIKFE